jgi:tRNA pseudouridine55 synthase
MASSQGTVNGILNIDKPSGWTSHDVVARVRRLAGQKRVGHTGTLDPMATGVLVVCLGQATRLAEYLVAGSKSYRATVRFGLTTDTWDADGEVLAERPTDSLSREALESLLPQFTGTLMQTPPMHSAIKRQGQPLYRLAHRGIVVERPARQIEISRLNLVAWQPPEAVLEVDCSKGTYIRALAHDLGEALGTGAILSSLQRTRVGQMTLAQAASLDALWAERESGEWRQHVVSLYDALAGWPRTIVDQEIIEALSHGRPVELALDRQSPLVALYDHQQQLIALVEPAEAPLEWRPTKVFVSDDRP